MNIGLCIRGSIEECFEWSSILGCIYGQHEAGAFSFLDFFRSICDLTKETEGLQGLSKLAQSAGWVQLCENTCFISERHNILNRDTQGRLHSLTGPAVAYPDDWSIYAIHGVRVPEYVVMRPHDITPRKIEAEKNENIRRVMIKRLGAIAS